MKLSAFLLIFMVLTASATPAPKAPARDKNMVALEGILSHLRTADGFHSPLVKTVHSGQLGGNTESKGEIYFSKGKMRLELTTPEKSLLVFDGEIAWQEQEFDDGDKKRAIVTKIAAKRIRKDSALLATLLGGDGDVLHSFKIVKVVTAKGIRHFVLRPKDKKSSDVVKLRVDTTRTLLRAIAYTDGLENEVSFKFSKMAEEKIPDAKFHYQPPKGAEVSEL